LDPAAALTRDVMNEQAVLGCRPGEALFIRALDRVTEAPSTRQNPLAETAQIAYNTVQLTIAGASSVCAQCGSDSPLDAALEPGRDELTGVSQLGRDGRRQPTDPYTR